MYTASEEGSFPDTSLIVCSRNRPAMLADTVASVLAGGRLPAELIIVDQSQTSHADLFEAQSARGCQIRYEWIRSRGLSRARNHGIQMAACPFVAFTDDDVLVTHQWFAILMSALKAAGPRSVVTGKVLMSEPERPGGFQLTIAAGTEPAIYEGRFGRDVLKPLNMAMSRSVFEELGGFDVRLGVGSHFPSSEDNDLGFRLLEAGYRIAYEPQAVLYHRAWRSGRQAYYSLNWNYGRGQGAYYAKYYSLRDPYMIKRTLGEFARYLEELPDRVRRFPRASILGESLFVIGVACGAVEWLLTQRADARATDCRPEVLAAREGP